MALRIITAEERLATESAIKGVIFGEAKIGKTSLLWTLDPATTLFVDLEAGGLSVQGWGGDSVEVRDWETAKNLACWIGGPNIAKRDNEDYSPPHYNFVCQQFGAPELLTKYKTVFIDSITEAGRLSFHWCKGRPEAFNKDGKPDNRGAYGLHGQEMVQWLKQLQHTKGKNIWFVGLLDRKEDDYGRRFWQPQIDGSKAGLELPGIMDQVVTMAEIVPPPGANGEQPQPYRAFICQKLNPWGFPGGDRSGTLDMIEEPNLGRLMEKIKAGRNRPFAESLNYGIPQQQQQNGGQHVGLQ